jgi:hypothetical protein
VVSATIAGPVITTVFALGRCPCSVADTQRSYAAFLSRAMTTTLINGGHGVRRLAGKGGNRRKVPLWTRSGALHESGAAGPGGDPDLRPDTRGPGEDPGQLRLTSPDGHVAPMGSR